MDQCFIFAYFILCFNLDFCLSWCFNFIGWSKNCSIRTFQIELVAGTFLRKRISISQLKLRTLNNSSLPVNRDDSIDDGLIGINIKNKLLNHFSRGGINTIKNSLDLSISLTLNAYWYLFLLLIFKHDFSLFWHDQIGVIRVNFKRFGLLLFQADE